MTEGLNVARVPQATAEASPSSSRGIASASFLQGFGSSGKIWLSLCMLLVLGTVGCGDGPARVVILAPINGTFTTAASVTVQAALLDVNLEAVADVQVNGVSVGPLNGVAGFYDYGDSGPRSDSAAHRRASDRSERNDSHGSRHVDFWGIDRGR